VYTDRRAYNIHLGAENNDISICTRGIRAGERRVNPIHKLGLKPVAAVVVAGQRGPTVDPPPLRDQLAAAQAHPRPPPIARVSLFLYITIAGRLYLL